MGRRVSTALRAWVVLIPALLHIGARRLRRARLRRPQAGRALSRPLEVDGRRVGVLHTADDGGTSTASTYAMLTGEVPAQTISPDLLVRAVADETRAAFDRGNHRSAWSVRDEQSLLIDVLRSSGFVHEGLAPPPAGDTGSWQVWSLLSTEELSTEEFSTEQLSTEDAGEIG